MLKNKWLKKDKNRPFTLPLNELIDYQLNGILEPKKIIESFLDRIKKKNKKIKAISSLNKSYIIDQFQKCGKKLPLSFIPVGIKDIYNTHVLPTTMGSKVFKDFYSGNDARIVTNLKRSGSIIFCKTVTAEFAVHHPGPTKNAYSIKYQCGTSSSGSAAAVASGMLPFAIGSQTAGSTIRPASYNGIYGYKPSFGVIPRTGVLKTLDTLDHVTFFARSNKDLKIIFDSLRVSGKNYPYVYKNFDLKKNKKFFNNYKKIRIAFLDQSNHVIIDEKQKKIIKELENKFKKNFITCNLNIDKLIKGKHYLHNKIYCRALAYYFKDEAKNFKNDLSKSFLQMINYGKRISVEEYKELLEQQSIFSRKIASLFRKYDFIISSSTYSCAPKLKQEEKKDMALIWTLSHVPSVNVPFLNKKEMPRGFQISSGRFNDYKLFEFLEILKKKKIIKDSLVVDNY